MEQINYHLFLLFNATPSSPLWIKGSASFIAKDLIAIIPLLIVALWIWSPRAILNQRRELVLKSGTALLYAMAISLLVGTLYPHPRPFALGLGYQWLAHSPDSSYPSDHGTAIFTFAIAFLCWHRLWSGALLIMLALSIAWSRVYLGVHWPIDMLGGVLVAMLGCLLSQLGWQIYGEWLLKMANSCYRWLFALPIKRGWVQP